jgi:putative NADPH-quinone reductase
LADAYAEGAVESGHLVRRIEVSALDFPLLRSQKAWEHGDVPPGLAGVQDDIRWAGHIVIVFPLWLGGMPALLKGLLEQVARPGFALLREEGGTAYVKKGLTGRSARVIVTMGMPTLVYRWYFGAHSLKSLERNILDFVGISPIHETLVGMAGNMKESAAKRWLARLRRLGREGT